MPIFHEEAIRAVAGEGKDLSWLRVEHSADSRGLARAIDYLCPEQRGDASCLMQARRCFVGSGVNFAGSRACWPGNSTN
jgi:hypothetical protein